MPYKDPKKQKAAQQKWYQENRLKVIEASLSQRDKNRLWLEDQRSNPCVDCGDKYPSCCMDFHHRDPLTKSFGISDGITRYARATIVAEIAKCDLVCSNCHRIRHNRFYNQGVAQLGQSTRFGSEKS
jgi:hypothetical protein